MPDLLPINQEIKKSKIIPVRLTVPSSPGPDQVHRAVRGVSHAAAGLRQEQPEQRAAARPPAGGGPVPGPAAHHGAAHQPALQRVH